MEINRRVVFRNDDGEAYGIIDYLKQNDIPYENNEITKLNILNILESNPNWVTISEFVKRYNFSCTANSIYTKKELLDAEWLTVRSQWHNGYPMPDEYFGYKSITYDNSDYCDICGVGLVQKDYFRLRKAPKWGSRHFMYLNWVEDEFFVSGTVKAIFESNSISGCECVNVLNKDGTEILPGVYQLKITSNIPNGFLNEQMQISDITHCPKCNSKKYLLNGRGMCEFNRKCFDDTPDIVKSSDLFGGGKLSCSKVLISQKIYRLIINNSLGRGLVFEPIKLV